MTKSSRIVPPPGHLALGIQGLPPLINLMSPGGVYVLIAATPPARFPLLAGSLSQAQESNVPVSVILPGQVELFVRRLKGHGMPGADQMVDSGKLQFFVFQDDLAKKMFRYGAGNFVRELDHFGLPQDSYLVIDPADELFSLHDIAMAMEQAEVLHQWAANNRITVLLAFVRTAAMPGAMNCLTGLLDHFSGIVHIGGQKDGLELTFDYWQSPDGTVAARSYSLNLTTAGNYAVNAVASEEAPLAAQLPPPDPVNNYFYSDGALSGLDRSLAGQWHHVDSMLGMVHATRGLNSPCVLLTYDRNSVLRQLSEAVHTLRLSLGKRAQIVVIEKDASLRYQNEALLLSLGTSLVVHRDVPLSRLPLLLESLQGQIFSRDVDINFEGALASVVPSRAKGYLAPARFAHESMAIVDRSKTLNIPVSLVVGTPVPNLDLYTLVSGVRISRPGDLMTTDQQMAYLVLNGCPEANLDTTLDRLLGAPANQVFQQLQVLTQREEQVKLLKNLDRRAATGMLPDFSAELSEADVQELTSARPEVPVSAEAPEPRSFARQQVQFKGAALSSAEVAPVQEPPDLPVKHVQAPLPSTPSAWLPDPASVTASRTMDAVAQTETRKLVVPNEGGLPRRPVLPPSLPSMSSAPRAPEHASQAAEKLAQQPAPAPEMVRPAGGGLAFPRLADLSPEFASQMAQARAPVPTSEAEVPAALPIVVPTPEPPSYHVPLTPRETVPLAEVKPERAVLARPAAIWPAAPPGVPVTSGEALRPEKSSAAQPLFARLQALTQEASRVPPAPVIEQETARIRTDFVPPASTCAASSVRFARARVCQNSAAEPEVLLTPAAPLPPDHSAAGLAVEQNAQEAAWQRGGFRYGGGASVQAPLADQKIPRATRTLPRG